MDGAALSVPRIPSIVPAVPGEGDGVPVPDCIIATWRADLDPTDAIAITVDTMHLARQAIARLDENKDWVAILQTERERLDELGYCQEAVLVIDMALEFVRDS